MIIVDWVESVQDSWSGVIVRFLVENYYPSLTRDLLS
jgi:hypothetical protein